tara:strand:- start:1204 stop:1896 length:693 start_codon:yes stop_codon:yes gene_type:complete
MLNKIKRIILFIIDKFKTFFISFLDDKNKFKFIYKTKYWQNIKDGSLSGSGSNKDTTKHLINDLKKFIKTNNVDSILDIPCGDLKWISNIDLNNKIYIGADIVPDLIEDNIKNYQKKNITFKCLDLKNDILPESDLIIVRDLLFHLTIKDIKKCLQNIVDHNFKFVAITNHEVKGSNKNTFFGDRWRPINLLESPFNLPNPDYKLSDYSSNNPHDTNKILAIWNKNNFKI